MAQTRGCHCVKAGYGLWLPGDDRGHGSKAWDEQVGYTEPHTPHTGDSVRPRTAQERTKRPPVKLTPAMIRLVESVVGECAAASP